MAQLYFGNLQGGKKKKKNKFLPLFKAPTEPSGESGQEDGVVWFLFALFSYLQSFRRC